MTDARKLLLGAAVAVAIFGLLIAVIGLDEFVNALQAITLREMVLLLGTALLGIAAMGSSFHVISRHLGLGFSRAEAVVLFTGINLAHNLTPFGQAGGEPIGAMLISKRTEHPYETCLAAISALDAINVIPALVLFALGGGYILLFDPIIPEGLRPVFLGVAIFVAVILSIAVVLRRRGRAIGRGLERLVGGLATRLGGVSNRLRVDPEVVARRVRGYTESLGSVAADRWTVVTSSSYSTLAFVTQGALLWLALLAVDIHLSFVLAVVIVPISLLASVVPLPGGGGGIEAVQVALIVTAAGAPLGPTLTAVVVSRGIVFWLPVLLGSITVAGIHLLERPERHHL